MKKYRGYQRCSRIDYANPGNAFAVTICTEARRPALNGLINDQLVKEIESMNHSAEWTVYLYCIMPDHLHLVVSPGQKGLADTVRLFKGRVAAKTRNNRERGVKLWQGSFFDHRIRSDESFPDKCNYILNNPVRAGLCEEAHEYAWSGVLAIN